MTTHTQGVTPETIAAAMAYTKPWEGFNPTVEPDGGGIPTLGHGFALIIGKADDGKSEAN